MPLLSLKNKKNDFNCFKNHLLLLPGLTGFESNKFQMILENIWTDSLLTVLELAWVFDKNVGGLPERLEFGTLE